MEFVVSYASHLEKRYAVGLKNMKKIKNIFQKPIDKAKRVWYNSQAVAERKTSKRGNGHWKSNNKRSSTKLSKDRDRRVWNLVNSNLRIKKYSKKQ